MADDSPAPAPRSGAKSKCDTIDRTNVTVRQIECALREHLHTDATLESWDYVEIGKGKGFISCLVRMELTWSSDDAKLPKSVAVKIPDLTNFKAAMSAAGTENTMQKFFDVISDNLKLIHNNEVVVYNMFGAMPEGDVPVPLAKCYGAKSISNNKEPDGYLILEDLSDSTASADMSVGFSYEQAKKLVDALARLHAWSMNNADVVKSAGLQVDMVKMMEPMFDTMIAAFTGFVAWINEPEQLSFYGDVCASRAGELKPDLSRLEEFSALHRQYGIPDILVHGDFWSNNILMCKDGDTTLPGDEISALIDWQMAHPGSAAEDIGRLLLMSCNNDLRTEHTGHLILFYYDQLKSHLGGQEPTFSMAQLTEFYERVYSTYAGMFLPFYQQMANMLSSEHALKSSDPDKLKRKLQEDCRSTLLEALRLKDKYASDH